MTVGAILIIMAWVVKMPLWASILTTILSGLHIIFKLIKSGVAIFGDFD